MTSRTKFYGAQTGRQLEPGAPERTKRGQLQQWAVTDDAMSSHETYSAAPTGGQFSNTDVANGHRLIQRYGTDIRFTTERGWYAWDGRRWVADEKGIRVQALAKQTVKLICEEGESGLSNQELLSHARRSQSKKAIEAMIWLARSDRGVLVRLTDFDCDAWKFNVGNGTVELKTGVLAQHCRQDLITNIADVNYDPHAVCKQWESFLKRIVGSDTELYAYLQTLVGYLLIGDTSEQTLHFLYGLGANGKSVFCEVVTRLLGDYAISVSPDLVMLRERSGIPNDVARLRGVRAAFMNETSQGAKFNESKLKELTGGDTLSARFLHQEFFDFRPTHRLIVRGNHKPSIVGTDEGIWRRLRLVPFVVAIPAEEQDKDLLRKLCEELPGILNWAIMGCLKWQKDGLIPPAIISDAVNQYRLDSDTLGRFLEEKCSLSPLSQVKSSVLYKAYQEFCQEAGERSLPTRDFPGELSRRELTPKRGTRGVRLIIGVELKAEGAYAAASDGW